MSVRLILIISFQIIGITLSFAQNKDVKMFCFGHSLIDHRPPAIPTPHDETSIVYWMDEIAKEDNRTFSAGGQYGFLTNHANLPPSANWGWNGITPSWDGDTQSFEDANINTILLTAANFIQYQPSHLPYPLDESTTVIDLTKKIFEWVDEKEKGVDYYIYANWPEMDLKVSFPPTIPPLAEINAFHNYTINDFTDWWIDYQDRMLLASPQINTRLIPVGQIISKIASQLLPNQIPFDEFYEDSDPHGRATTYFLAGMITYMAVYEKNIPDDYMPSDIVYQTVRDSLQLIRNFAWDELNQFNFTNGTSRVFVNTITTTSLPELHKLKIVPNPNYGEFYISGISPEHKIDIIDVNGRLVKSITRTSNLETINTQSLADGLYYIQLLDKFNQIIGAKRMLKL